jgi:hypothetical protein
MFLSRLERGGAGIRWDWFHTWTAILGFLGHRGFWECWTFDAKVTTVLGNQAGILAGQGRLSRCLPQR